MRPGEKITQDWQQSQLRLTTLAKGIWTRRFTPARGAGFSLPAAPSTNHKAQGPMKVLLRSLFPFRTNMRSRQLQTREGRRPLSRTRRRASAEEVKRNRPARVAVDEVEHVEGDQRATSCVMRSKATVESSCVTVTSGVPTATATDDATRIPLTPEMLIAGKRWDWPRSLKMLWSTIVCP